VGSSLLLLAYDSNKRLPNGRFAPEEEGPSIGAIEVNKLDCGVSALTDWGNGAFYSVPETKTVGGWPQFGGTVFMTRRTQPRFLPVTVERLINAQLEKARKDLKEVMDSESLREQAKAQGGGLNQMFDEMEARASKTVKDLEARLNSLSSEQRAAQAALYLAVDGPFEPGQVVPAGTKGASTPVAYLNPDFYDKTIPEWEAQSICIGLITGSRARAGRLFPTIQNIWNSLDWDAIAKVLK
jgi:hypothetical protein